MKHFLSTGPNLSLYKAGPITEIRIYSNVNDGQLSMVQPCQDINGSSFLQEIQHHLPSDFFGICTDPFGHDAVIGGKHIGSFVQRPARVAFPDGNQSCRNVLEPAKTPPWFRQIVEM